VSVYISQLLTFIPGSVLQNSFFVDRLQPNSGHTVGEWESPLLAVMLRSGSIWTLPRFRSALYRLETNIWPTAPESSSVGMRATSTERFLEHWVREKKKLLGLGTGDDDDDDDAALCFDAEQTL